MLVERTLVCNKKQYLDIIRFWFGKEWDDSEASWKELQECHGIPSAYPAIVTVKKELTASPFYLTTIEIIDPLNVLIPRPKSDMNTIDDL